jgi:hypothetical protein
MGLGNSPPRPPRHYEGLENFEAGTAIKVTMALETSCSRPPDIENTSDSETMIFLPLLITFERHTTASPAAGLK